MKNFHIILFIAGVFCLLALLCLVFPKKGIDLTLHFPSLEEVFAVKSHQGNLEESLRGVESDFVATMDSISDDLANADSLAFVDSLRFYTSFDTASVARLSFPNNDPHLLDKVFQTFEENTKGRCTFFTMAIRKLS